MALVYSPMESAYSFALKAIFSVSSIRSALGPSDLGERDAEEVQTW